MNCNARGISYRAQVYRLSANSIDTDLSQPSMIEKSIFNEYRIQNEEKWEKIK